MKHSPVCSNCESNAAECICNKCQIYYCSECFQAIHSVRALQNHSPMSINDKLSKIVLCDKHPDARLKHWCQECHTSVCSDCLLDDHKDHKSILINTSSKELERKVCISYSYFSNNHFSSSLDQSRFRKNSIIFKS